MAKTFEERRKENLKKYGISTFEDRRRENLNKYNPAPQTQPAPQKGAQAVSNSGDTLTRQMRATGYLTDTPVGNTRKVQRTTRTSADLRKQLDGINTKIAEFQAKAKEAENDEWLASISHITFNDPTYTLDEAKSRRGAALAAVSAYQRQRDTVAAQLDDTIYNEYMELAKDPHFAELSRYRTTRTGKPENDKLVGSAGYVSEAFADPLYDYINGNKEAEGFIAIQESKTGAKAKGFDKTKYSQMTPEEVAVYNYLYTKGKDRADEFLKDIDKKLSQRQAGIEAARIDAEPNALKRGAAKIITAGQSGLDSSIQGLAQAMTDEVLPKSQLSYTGAAVKETTSGLGRLAYDSVELVSHMLPSILTSYAIGGAGGAIATTTKGIKTVRNMGQIASSLVTAVSAAGNSYAEQMEKGITKKQSKTIAALTGASEGGLQYLLSGISAMGGKATNNILSNKIAGIGNGLARVGAKFVASGIGEATEEVLQLFVEPAIIAAVTGEAYQAPEVEEIIYTALLSAISAGFFEGAEIVRDEAGLRAAGRVVLATDGVRAVIDAAANSDNPSMQRLAKKLDKKLSEGKSKKISAYDLGRAMAESANAVETPEETADTLTAVNETPAAVGETLSPAEQATPTKQVPLETKAETTFAADGTPTVKMPQVIRRDQPAETAEPVEIEDPYPGVATHSSTGRRYTELERSGIATGASQEMIDTVKRLANLTKRRVLFYDGNTKTGDWARANGAYTADNDTIYINSRGTNPAAQIFAHEMTHSVEGTDSYGGLSKMVLDYMAQQGNDLDAMREAKRKAYGRSDANFDVDAELVAEFVETKLLTDEAEIRKVAASRPSLARAILEKINSFIARLPFAKGAQERDFLIRARDMYSRALKEAQARSDKYNEADMEREGTRFAFADIKIPTYEELINKPDIEVVDIRSNDARSFSEQREDYKKEKLADVYSEPIANVDTGEKIFVDHRTFRHSFSNDDAEKMAMAKQMKKLLETAVLTHSEPSKSAPNDLSTGVYTLFAAAFTDDGVQPVRIKVKEYYIGNQNLPEVVQNYINRAGAADVYAITYDGKVLVLDDIEKEDASSSARPTTDFSEAETYPSAPSTISIKELIGLVNDEYRKYLPKPSGEPNSTAMPFAKETDSTGATLTKEQQKYFANSKAVDKNGKLLVLYHQTDSDFNIFNPLHKGAGTSDSGTPFGIFLKSSNADIGLRGKKQMRLYANIENPLIANSREDLNYKLRRLSSEYEQITTRLAEINGEYQQKVNDANAAWNDYVAEWRKNNPTASRKEIYNDPEFVRISDAEEAIIEEWEAEGDKVSQEAKRALTSALRDAGYDGVFLLNDAGSWGRRTDAYIALDPEQVKNTSNKTPTTDKDIRFSIPSEPAEQTEPTEQTEQTEEKAPSFSTFPKKAQRTIKAAERYLITGIGNLLSVPGARNVEEFQTLARKATDAYLKNGRVPDDLIDDLFDTAYEKGRQIDDEFYNTYKHVKDYLRKTPVVLRAEYRSDMGDYNEFRKKAFNVLNLNTAATRGIDQVYLDLIQMAPELFPEDITHPADQLQRMYDVAVSIQKVEHNLDEVYGPEAEGYKAWAREQFRADINDYVGELNSAKRYADAEAAKRIKPEQTLTVEGVKGLYKQLKPLKRELEKVTAKNLLTDADRLQVGRLLRGDILLKHLDPETDNVKGITEVYEAALKCEEITNQINEYRQNAKAAKRAVAQELVGDTQQWKDRLTGIMFDRETPERNIRKVVKSPEQAEALIKAYITPIHEHEADANRFKTDYRNRVDALKLSRKINKGDAVSESYAVQLLGEAEDCIAYLKQAMRSVPTNKRDKLQRGGKSLADWQAVVENLFIENPGLDEAKIRNAVEEFRAIYDELFEQMNDVRIRNGYEPVSYRRGYFPHFQASDPDGLLATFGKALGITTDIVALPTTINGLTHTFKPGIRWFGNALERVGFETTYDAVQGFDKYIEGVADVIHHTDDIQNLRALSGWIRYAASDAGIKEQENAILADPNRSEEDKELAKQELYRDGKYRLSKFVNWLEEYTNLLANKKSRSDRDLENALNRNIYNAAKNLESRVAANMVSINIGSWLTNFIPITQAAAGIKTKYLLKGMVKTLVAIKNNDGIVSRSAFLTNRRGSDPLVQTWAQKTSAVLSKGMDLVDSFTSDTIVRARYYENLSKGMSEEAALSDADAFAASVIADRSKGAMPTLFQQKNPITKLFTQFQLEVNNQLSYLFRDIPREMKDKGIAAFAMALLKFMVGAWLYNEAYEFLIGRRPALDILNILNETVGDITGWEIPNLIDIGRAAAKGEEISFESERETFGGTMANLGKNVFEQVPFTSLLNLAGMDIDAGRVAISSAVPNFGKIADAFEKGVSGKKRLQTLAKELGKPAAYILPPFGGGQIKKIVEGISAVSRGGSYTVDKDGNDILQYPVYRDTTNQAFKAALGAAIFGKSSLRTGREWVESGFKSLSAKDTALYQALTDLGVGEEKAYNFIKEFKAIEKTDTESELTLQRKSLAESDLSDRAKTVVYYSLLASNSEKDALKPILEDDKKMTDTAKKVLKFYKVDPENEKALAMVEAGLTAEQYIAIRDEYRRLDGADLTAQGKASQFSSWLNNQNLTAEQKAIIKENFKYYSFVKQEAERYDAFIKAGISDKVASDLDTAIRELKPLEGKTTVSAVQKWNAAVSKVTDEKQLQGALEALMSDDQYAAYKDVIEKAGIPSAMYVKGKTLLSEYGSGPSNEEITWAIQDMASNKLELPAVGKTKGTLTDKQRAILWQLWTGSTSTKNNPWAKTKEIRNVVQPIADEAKAKAEEAKEKREAEAEAQRKARGK